MTVYDDVTSLEGMAINFSMTFSPYKYKVFRKTMRVLFHYFWLHHQMQVFSRQAVKQSQWHFHNSQYQSKVWTHLANFVHCRYKLKKLNIMNNVCGCLCVQTWLLMCNHVSQIGNYHYYLLASWSVSKEFQCHAFKFLVFIATDSFCFCICST